jgi:hypothetical protein
VNTQSTWPTWSNVSGFPDGFEGTNAQFNTRWGNRMGSPQWNRHPFRTVGQFSLADSPSGNYSQTDTTSIDKLADVDLTDRTGCQLLYHLFIDTEFSNDANNLNDDWFEILVEGMIVSGWAGFSDGFLAFEDDLSDFDDESDLGLRFRILADDPAKNVADLKADILGGVDDIPALTTRVLTGGRLNAAKALGLEPDDTPPNTTITSGPSGRTNKHKATFRFTGAGPGGRFECKHMNGPWTPCSSPKTYTGLGNGRHVFQVRAMDKERERRSHAGYPRVAHRLAGPA